MTATATPMPNDSPQIHRLIPAALLAVGLGGVLGVAGTLLLTDDAASPVRPAVVERPAVDPSATPDENYVSSCRLASADAVERCVANR